MSHRFWAVAAVAACLSSPAFADVVSPDSSYIRVTFTSAKAGSRSQFPLGLKYVTISPDGTGETFASNGILIEAWIKSTTGPIIGMPADEIVLFSTALCICPGGNIADAATDSNGRTTFTGTIRGGGCATSLAVFAGGSLIGVTTGGLDNVAINSWDAVPASPCFVDAGDTASFAGRLGIPANYNICSDYNEDGFIDAGDVASFAQHLGAACQ